MDTNTYQAFTLQLTVNLQADNRVQGLVLLGSTANQNRAPDEWSDHDFFVITASGQQEDFRTRFDWLPNHNHIVLTVRETAHGLKVLYANGHLLEYAVFDLAEINLAKANDYHVVFDRSGVEAAMQTITTKTDDSSYSQSDLQRDMGMFLCLLVVGAGRVARGEVISGQVFIRAYATGHLLKALSHIVEAKDEHVEKTQLDNLDPLRRFEQLFPQIGTDINAALAYPPIDAARRLLDIYEQMFRDIKGYSAESVATTRRFLHKTT